MKKKMAILTIAICALTFLVCFSLALADGEAWLCPNCNTSVTGNFCSSCGTANPNETGDKSGHTLHLEIDFEKNMLFSTYDVEVYVNETKVATIPHGQELEQSLQVSDGPCSIAFYEDGDHSVRGTTDIVITQDTEFSCEIHAKNNKIVVDEIQTDGGRMDSKAAVAENDQANSRIAAGETGEIDGLSVTLTKFYESKGSSFNKPDTGNVFVLCDFEIVNNGKDEAHISSLASFEAYCDDYKYGSSFSAILEANTQLDGSIDAGRKLKGTVGFEVPKGWDTMEVEFSPNIWGSDKLVFVFNRK